MDRGQDCYPMHSNLRTEPTTLSAVAHMARQRLGNRTENATWTICHSLGWEYSLLEGVFLVAMCQIYTQARKRRNAEQTWLVRCGRPRRECCIHPDQKLASQTSNCPKLSTLCVGHKGPSMPRYTKGPFALDGLALAMASLHTDQGPGLQGMSKLPTGLSPCHSLLE